MRILMLGDIVGRPGRAALKARLPRLREKLNLDAVIANGENAAGGVGLTRETLREMFAAGVDVVTGGNHTWRHPEIYATLNEDKRVLRPANAPAGAPGRGGLVHALADGRPFAVLNLLGRSFMDPADCPFHVAERELADIPESVRLRFVDFHAEATSEKRAMGRHLDGRATCVAGTHTHVQTLDAAILPGGTAYISDLGMCGNEAGSILGMEPKAVLDRFITGLPVRFRPAPGEGTLNGLIIDADEATGKALAVTVLREKAPAISDPAAGCSGPESRMP